MTTTNTNPYLVQIQEWDWKALKKEVAAQEVDDEGNQTVWLGSYTYLAPSGKYYTAWAMSNLLECSTCDGQDNDCPECDGTNYPEAFQDDQYFEALETVAAESDLWVWTEADEVYLGCAAEIDEE